MATAQDLIVVRSRRTGRPARTLVCLGFCGGGTGQYHQWGDAVPPDVDLAAVCYPGREGRFLEDFAQNWDELADDTTEAVLSTADGPYVLFGHSMGGWMAFDVAARIERRGGPAPEALVVSSANAPSRGLTIQDMFPSRKDSDEQLLGWMNRHGMMPAHVLDDPELQELAVELMRADIKVRDTFHYVPGTRVGVPLHVLTGDSDSVIDADAGEQWRELTRGTFRHDVLPGGHFYTPEVWAALPSRIPALSGATIR
ncbi:thioesterase II family protein [Kitasatospora sp. CB01950]|uniref:thioesterase II family protein n=1 Tax=Kitasatospora sp. CB01950 TaxID=1703930 RepID=UPI000939B4B6|nr:alpha/beta fold hydrolase [Kitasatospora sp. CB01950]OKI92983.1 thioesterase [Kitasatospora sp. CB01950]